MRDDGEFEAYLVARWVPVVRTLVMLGCAEPRAEEIALSAFARLRAGWTAAQEADPDVTTFEHVLDEWDRAGWTRGAGSHEPRTDDDAWRDLEPALDRLPYDERTALLLTHVAHLDETQRVEVLGTRPEPVRSVPGETVAEAAESITVLPPSLEQVAIRARDLRRDGRRRAALGTVTVVAVAVLLGAAAWWGAPSGSDEHGPAPLGAAPTVFEDNPAAVAWYADGELHLEQVVVDLPPLRDLVAVNGGAVYVDEDGAVVWVAYDGARRRLGVTDTGSVVGSDEEGWVSWTDTTGGEPVLVLYDVTSRQRIRTVAPPVPGHKSAVRLLPVAIDQGLLYFQMAGDGTSYAVAPDGLAQHVGLHLLDVSSATRVFQSGPGSIRMMQSFSSTVTGGLGDGAQLSPDGNLLLTRLPVEQSMYGMVELYDTRSGDLLASGLGSEDVAVDAAFGPDNTVTYIVADQADNPTPLAFLNHSFSGELELRTCEVETPAPGCHVDATFPGTGSTPILGPA